MISALDLSALSPPSANQALSGIFGSISLTAWICLLVRRRTSAPSPYAAIRPPTALGSQARACATDADVLPFFGL